MYGMEVMDVSKYGGVHDPNYRSMPYQLFDWSFMTHVRKFPLYLTGVCILSGWLADLRYLSELPQNLTLNNISVIKLQT
jgi:hypothetical protein